MNSPEQTDTIIIMALSGCNCITGAMIYADLVPSSLTLHRHSLHTQLSVRESDLKPIINWGAGMKKYFIRYTLRRT